MTNSEKTVNSTTPVRRVKGERRFHQAEKPLDSPSDVPGEAPEPDGSPPVPVSGFSVVVLTTRFSPPPTPLEHPPLAPRGCPTNTARRPTAGAAALLPPGVGYVLAVRRPARRAPVPTSPVPMEYEVTRWFQEQPRHTSTT